MPPAQGGGHIHNSHPPGRHQSPNMPSRDRSRSPHERRRSHSDRRDDSRDRERDRNSSKTYHESSKRSRHDRDDRDRSDRREKDRGDRKHRGRERSRDRERRGGRDRDRDCRRRSISESSEDLLDLAEIGVKPITDDDYFLKAGEFRYWLKEERGKYLDQLSSSDAHKYFRRFVRRWNDGALPRDCYYVHESTAARAADNTAYKWSFTARSRFNSQELAEARASVDRMTHAKAKAAALAAEEAAAEVGPVPIAGSRSPSPGPHLAGPTVGPTAPSVADRQLARETAREVQDKERRAERKTERNKLLDRAEDLVPRAVGKEAKIAEKRATNAENRKFADKDSAAGLEVDDGTLMGDDGGFAAALLAREGLDRRRADKKAEEEAEKRAAWGERVSERREKESATMEMLKNIAKKRFG